MKLKSNLKAPNFKLPSTDKTIFELKKIKKNIILYFYPKDFTPGCTIQACSLRDINYDLKDKEVIVLGISYDSIKKHDNFSKEHKLNFPLLSDSDKTVSKLYDSAGWLFPKRKTFIIDKNGVIVHIIDPVNVNTHNDIILSVIDSLKTVKTK